MFLLFPNYRAKCIFIKVWNCIKQVLIYYFKDIKKLNKI